MTDATTRREVGTGDELAAGSARNMELCVVHSPNSANVGARLELQRSGHVLIGRRAGVDLSIEDDRISRSHLRLVWDPRSHAHRFADLGSANGTYVNGARTDSGLLSNDDVVRLGDTLLVASSTGTRDEFAKSMARAARSNLPVLILGETGSGKELLGRRVHELSGRRGAFIAVNCAALPKDLAAAELFGHTRGAFSGAGVAREGLLKAASGGTLFLDEIGDLPLDLQPTLLRSLQEHTVRPLGSDREISVDLRVVSATHADLDNMSVQGRFREDLLARLAHLVFRVPPLRRRRTEILELAATFAPGLEWSSAAAEALVVADWPRNVRQLRALVECLAILTSERTPIGLQELAQYAPDLVRSKSAVAREASDDPRAELSELLKKHSGNVASVARELGKPRSHVYRWMRNFRLTRRNFEG